MSNLKTAMDAPSNNLELLTKALAKCLELGVNNEVGVCVGARRIFVGVSANTTVRIPHNTT